MMLGCCCANDGGDKDDREAPQVVAMSAMEDQPPEPLPLVSPAKEAKADEAEPKKKAEAEPAKMSASANAFEIELRRGGGQCGISIDAFQVGVQITELGPGIFQTYNETAPAEKRVQKDDFLVSVNGSDQVATMLEHLKAADAMNIKIIRPTGFAAKLKKTGKKMGISLQYQENVSNLLVISEVEDEGTVKDYNSTVPQHLQLKVWDFIKSANGVSGAVLEILDAMQASDELDLQLLRLSSE